MKRQTDKALTLTPEWPGAWVTRRGSFFHSEHDESMYEAAYALFCFWYDKRCSLVALIVRFCWSCRNGDLCEVFVRQIGISARFSFGRLGCRFRWAVPLTVSHTLRPKNDGQVTLYFCAVTVSETWNIRRRANFDLSKERMPGAMVATSSRLGGSPRSTAMYSRSFVCSWMAFLNAKYIQDVSLFAIRCGPHAKPAEGVEKTAKCLFDFWAGHRVWTAYIFQTHTKNNSLEKKLIKIIKN
jgi:hypothetical protein